MDRKLNIYQPKLTTIMQDSGNPSGNAQLDATIQALQGGNLTGLAPQAGANIQSWISTLQNSNNGQLSGIAS